MHEANFSVRIQAITFEATDVCSYILKSTDGSALPSFEPGAHIDVEMANGLERSYSLSSTGQDGTYRLTIARDAKSSGGSKYLHEQVRPGDIVNISNPRNNFPLDEKAERSVFISGGIGVTPFIPMAHRLNELSRPWRIHFCVRTRDRAALIDELAVLADAGHGELIPNFDEEPGGRMLDLSEVIEQLGPQDHVYCCGPIPMLDAFRSACAAHGIDEARVHFEYFSSANERATGGGFDVILAKSGITLRVDEGNTILQTVLSAGIDVPYSCEDGVCGACETAVLDGIPDHRDVILSDREKKAGKSMMICCSGSKSPSLTLDR